ncbi:MAG: hypothetical protein ACYTG4_09895 [Planctomycetota bacterium]|jgi:hypothetical protein
MRGVVLIVLGSVLLLATIALVGLLGAPSGEEAEGPVLPAVRSVTPPAPSQLPPRTLAEVQQQVVQLGSLSALEAILGPKDRDVPDPAWNPTAVFHLDDGVLLVPHAHNSVLEIRFAKSLEAVTRPDSSIARGAGKLIQRPW